MNRRNTVRRSEPRVVCDGLVYHYRRTHTVLVCDAAPAGSLAPQTVAVAMGLTVCGECAYRLGTWQQLV
jgi:hypothetical protein